MNTEMSTDRVPSWEDVRSASVELDQMASQTVLKACEIGDMLRTIRLTMDAESFNNHLLLKLNRSQPWSVKLIVLSFRRSAVLEALASGQANDSIRSAYEHVKSLPEPSEETSERERWPRAQRGPEKGSGGRPKDNPEAHEAAKRGEPKPKREKKPAEKKPESEDMAKQFRYLFAADAYLEITGERVGTNFIRAHLRPEIESNISWAKEIDPRNPLTDAQAEDIRRVVFAYAERTGKAKHCDPEALNAKEESIVEREIKRRLRLLEAQMEERNKAQLEEMVKMYSSEYARFRSFNESYRGVFSEEEYRLLLSVLHPDRCPPERASQFSRAFHLVKSKEEILCGEKESDLPSTLPSSLAELMARRKMN